ncbi:Holliday junction branch migration protein RuvA [Salinibacterium sp. ZJ77]|uniref:Holliday junction branch migration protein RuvA n=1 Tax=Salinibacterium sp. ZJ77 TaxID=2708337 RepID=UPI001420FE82|nr:Holliday junction branch migration protein RuvA [Salinibacterium sp. ZJ77]
MISSVRGIVLHAGVGHVVVEVGGIGLRIAVTPALALSMRTGSEAALHTALIVREDDMSLFGFASRDELEIFDILRGVSGVGPKSALGVLAQLSPDEIARAVTAEDDAPFRKVSGIGPKTAKLLVVSLAGKIVAPAATASAPVVSSADTDVVAALVGLGWPERTATTTLDDIRAGAGGGDLDAQALLRLALARLGPGGRR